MGRFTDKVALITGGSQGLGRETAILFAKEGAKVVIAGISEASQTLNAIKTAGGEAIFVKADVANTCEVQTMIQTAVDTYGKLDILYNNAAILGDPSPIADMTEEDFDRTMAVNVKGVFLGMKYGIRQMLKQGGGVIVNCGSVSSFVADPNNADYLASKGAVMMLTRAGALEYAQQNIRINAVCPGPMRTPMLEAAAKKAIKPWTSLRCNGTSLRSPVICEPGRRPPATPPSTGSIPSLRLRARWRRTGGILAPRGSFVGRCTFAREQFRCTLTPAAIVAVESRAVSGNYPHVINPSILE